MAVAMSLNTSEHIEAHFGVPMLRAVLTSLDGRLDTRKQPHAGHSEIMGREHSKVDAHAMRWPCCRRRVDFPWSTVAARSERTPAPISA